MLPNNCHIFADLAHQGQAEGGADLGSLETGARTFAVGEGSTKKQKVGVGSRLTHSGPNWRIKFCQPLRKSCCLFNGPAFTSGLLSLRPLPSCAAKAEVSSLYFTQFYLTRLFPCIAVLGITGFLGRQHWGSFAAISSKADVWAIADILECLRTHRDVHLGHNEDGGCG